MKKITFLLLLSIAMASAIYAQNSYPASGNATISGITVGVGAGSVPTNTALGRTALSSNTRGMNNTALGNNCLLANSTGNNNTGIGSNSLFANTTGNYNTATGSFALYSNTGGNSNSATGQEALYFNTTGYSNVAVGNKALYSNTTGYYNTANGVTALKFNTTGINNTANGFAALYTNTTGDDNTASGYLSLSTNTVGFFNTAYGYLSLSLNTTGNFNTATGSQALYSNTTGAGNTANGDYALDLSTTGNFNTAYGYGSLNSNTTGNYNTAIGFNTNPADGSITNYTALGYLAGSSASTSNMVEIGNTSVKVIRGEVGFSTYSDERIKNTIKDNVPGLAFINLLKPVTYHLDIHKQNQLLYAGKTTNGMTADADYPAKYDLEKQQMTGFLAQDVESAAESINYDFSGVVKPQNEHDLYGLRYSDFVVPLVKAVQELSAQNESLQNRVSTLEAQLNSANINGMVKVSIANPGNSTLLGQNIPNPFDHSTLIPFRIPADCHDASIAIVETATGKIIHLIPVSCTETQLSFDAGSLATGNYSYSLYVDGKLVETKQMILTK